MNKLKKFITALFILFLFAGCRTGIPPETPRYGDLQEIENALMEGNWNQVVSYGETHLEDKPVDAIVNFVLGIAYYMKGEYVLQEKQYSLALNDKQSMDAIVAWAENLVQRFPKNYYANFLLGSAYPIIDEMEKAVESYKRAIEINPNLADAYVGLGAIYADNEQTDEAARYYRKAIEVNPTYIAAYLNLGALYEYNDQLDEAIASYEKVVEINPRFTAAYVLIGNSYLEKGNREKAIEAYRKVIELNPDGELGIYAKDAIEKAQADSDKDTADTKEQRKP